MLYEQSAKTGMCNMSRWQLAFVFILCEITYGFNMASNDIHLPAWDIP